MEWETVFYEAGAGVAVVTLNRPEKFNAFNRQLHKDLAAALKAAARDTAVRCVVITGQGKAFCAGHDLSEDPGRPLGEWVQEYYNPLLLSIRDLEKPVLAAVNGVAAGAGLSLALACDLRVATEAATFTTAFTAVGLVPDTGVSYFLPRLVGFAKAMELCLLPERVSAAEAVRLGFVNLVASAADFADTWRAWAERLGRGPRSLAYTKRLLNLSLESTLRDQIQQEAWFQELAGKTADMREGVQAFREKRSPQFQGR